MKKIIRTIKKLFRPQREKKILVIDDAEVDRRIAQSILEKRFYVLTANGGRDGLAMAQETLPDLILLDFMMPDMQGPEVCALLKEDERTRDIPVIFLTSMDTPMTVVDSFEKGAEIYLTKPVSRLELISQVEIALDSAVSVKE